MRNCLCCKVTTGSLLLGLLTLFSSILILIPLVAYYVDIPYFSIIRDKNSLIYNVEGKSDSCSGLIYINVFVCFSDPQEARLDQGPC